MSILFYASPPGTPGNDSYTKLLLHGDESPLVDSSSGAKSLTLNGGIARNAAQSKFGGYSILCGAGKSIECADSDDWFVSSNDFTFDCWFYATNFTNGFGHYFFSQGDSTGADDWAIWIEADGGGNLKLSTREVIGNTQIWRYDQAITVNTGQWYHFALVKNGSNLQFYLDGTAQGAGYTRASIANHGYPMKFFRASYDPAKQEWQGYVDEARYSNGIARWPSNFTPPTSAYI